MTLPSGSVPPQAASASIARATRIARRTDMSASRARSVSKAIPRAARAASLSALAAFQDPKERPGLQLLDREPGAAGRLLGGDGAAVDRPEERSEEPRLNSSHVRISYAVFCLKKKNLR